MARAVAWIVLFDVFAHSKIKSGDLPMADSAAAPVLPDVGSFGWVQDQGSKYWAKCLETNQPHTHCEMSQLGQRLAEIYIFN